MLYHLEFTVEYGAAMSQQDLFKIWSEEAKAALGAKDAGVVKGLWKAAGMRKVFAVVEVESADMLDAISFDLPIMKDMGQHVDIKVTSIRAYEDFAADVNKRLD
jgi:muconolactone D-isomerase